MKRQLIGLAVACVLGLGAGLPGLAQAAPALASAPSGQAPSQKSPLIAGWTSDLVGDASVKRFVVPSIECRGVVNEGVGIGVGHQEHAGFWEIAAQVLMFCDPEPQYQIDVVVDGRHEGSAVSEGDELRFEITYSSGTATATVTNRTNPGGSLTMTGAADPLALHFGAFTLASIGSNWTMPDFGNVRLVKARSAATPLSESTATKVLRVRHREVTIGVGGISTAPQSAGSFRLRYENH